MSHEGALSSAGHSLWADPWPGPVNFSRARTDKVENNPGGRRHTGTFWQDAIGNPPGSGRAIGAGWLGEILNVTMAFQRVGAWPSARSSHIYRGRPVGCAGTRPDLRAQGQGAPGAAAVRPGHARANADRHPGRQGAGADLR